MVDRLYRLRHDTIVCCNDKYCNICGTCTSKTHCRKCLMTRCIKECDALSVDVDNRCSDMLCDSAGLSVCYIRVTDCIEEGSLTMVNVSHNADNRWTFFHLLFVLFFLF